MNKIAADPTQPYRSLIAGYTDAIRQSDFKANIAFLFVAFMMGSVLWNYTAFPPYLSVQLVLLPFLIVYLLSCSWCLFRATPSAAPRASSLRAT